LKAKKNTHMNFSRILLFSLALLYSAAAYAQPRLESWPGFASATTSFNPRFTQGLITTANITPAQSSMFFGTIQTNWWPIDTLNNGIDSCDHEWLSSDPDSYASSGGRGMTISCAVNHAPGTRCSWTIQTRKSICKKCLLHIVETDENPNPPAPIPKPEPVETYETLLAKINKKK